MNEENKTEIGVFTTPKMITISFDSPMNISFRYEEELCLEEIVGDIEDWSRMTEDERYDAVKEVFMEILFESYIEWNYFESE